MRGFRCSRGAVYAAAAVVLGSATLAGGSDPPPVMRVEEDWECVLVEPELDLTSPQFHTVIAPYGDTESYYFQVCWNYADHPNFLIGGLQMLAFNGEMYAGGKRYREDPLSTVAEAITWTQSLDLRGGQLVLEISNGNSNTWGGFGGGDSTKLGGRVSVANLNGYSTDVSAGESWVSYGGNRVEVLRIKEVRRYDADGNLLSRDENVRVVYAFEG